MRHFLTSIVAALLLGTLTGCATIPAKLTLVSVSVDQVKSTSSADCLLPQTLALPITQTTAALNPHHIAVLDWNVYKGQRSNWLAEFRQLLPAQDLILLQEAVLNDTLEANLYAQHLYWTLNHSFIYGEHATGVMTVARISPLSSCGLRRTEPLLRTPKTTLVQTYRIAGQPQALLVANIHGINFSLDTEVYAQQLHDLQTLLAQHHGPVILAGDFNNWSEARTQVLQNMIQQLQLDSLPHSDQHATRVFGHSIDHVYYRNLDVVAQQTLAVSSSDHNPIQVVFRLSPTQLTWRQP